MVDILMKAGCYVGIIFMGYFLKCAGFFKQEDFTVISKITMRITMPCAIITSFAGRTIDPSMLSLPLLAFCFGLIYIGIGCFSNVSEPKEHRAFKMLNLAGYNIGSFVYPFAQSFLGPTGLLAVSLFDTGNAVICLGGAFSLAAMVNDNSKFSLLRIIKTLLRSPPFVCYLVMLIMNLLHLSIPQIVLSFAQMGGSANPFMAMLMIGVGFRLEGNRSQIGALARLLACRYSVAAILASVCYFFLPFSIEIRQALVIMLFGPIGSVAPAFTGEMKGDVGLSSALNSVAIIISIAIIVVLMIVML